MARRATMLVHFGCAVCVLFLAAPSFATAEGDFNLIAMAHTQDWPNNSQVRPWDGKTGGEFVYRGIPCAGNAPVNNISSNLPTYNSRIPGSRSPASTRSHPFKFTAKGDKLSGSISLTVCGLKPGPAKDKQADSERERILITFDADAKRLAAEETAFSGSFKIAGGTGRYSKLAGEGVIRGYFTCLDPQGCGGANKGQLRDLQYVLAGKFNDPAFQQETR